VFPAAYPQTPGYISHLVTFVGTTEKAVKTESMRYEEYRTPRECFSDRMRYFGAAMNIVCGGRGCFQPHLSGMISKQDKRVIYLIMQYILLLTKN
jgi:hypothetical protein